MHNHTVIYVYIYTPSHSEHKPVYFSSVVFPLPPVPDAGVSDSYTKKDVKYWSPDITKTCFSAANMLHMLHMLHVTGVFAWTLQGPMQIRL